MEDILIKETTETPSVEMSFSKGFFKIAGKSIPENATNFFNPILNGLDAYRKQPLASTVVEFRLEYFNTSTSKYLLDMLKQFEAMNSESNKVEVHWFYEENDEEILEIGEDLNNMIDIPFKIEMIHNN